MSISLRDRGLNTIFKKAIEDGQISKAELQQLKVATEDGRGLSKTERSDLERLAAHADLFQAGAHADLMSFLGLGQDTSQQDGRPLSFKDKGLKAAAQQLMLQDGINLAEVDALLDAAADGRGLSKTERTDLSRLLVRGKFDVDAKQKLMEALGIGQPDPVDPPGDTPDVDQNGPVQIPDPFPEVVFDEHNKCEKVDSLLLSASRSAQRKLLYSGVTTWSNPTGPKLFFGDGWVAQKFDITATRQGKQALCMANPTTGQTAWVSGKMMDLLLQPSDKHGGRLMLEVMGYARSRETRYGSFAFEHGYLKETNRYASSRGPKVDMRTDESTRNAQLSATPDTTMSLQDAARQLKKAFGTAARAVDDVTSTPVITQKDLELLAIESDAPKELQAAARSILMQGGLQTVDVAAGKRFPDGRISLAALDAIIDPSTVPLKTRPLADPSLYALDYMDTTGPNARPLGRDRQLQVTVWAAPGAKISLYNRMIPDGGEPKKIHTHKVDTNAPNPNADGLVKVTIPVPKDAEWAMGDRLALTQQMGTREQSVAIEIDVRGKGGYGHGRTPMLDKNKVCVSDDGWLRSTGDYAATPYKRLTLLKNGVDTGVVITADAYGRFEAKLPGELSDGQWELREGYRDNAVRVPLGTDQLVNARAKAGQWLQEVRRALMRPPQSNRIQHSLTGVEPGWTVTVNNPGAGGGPMQFVADDSGKLNIDVPGVAVGDTLQLTFGELKFVDYWLRETTYNLTVPTAAQTARIEHVMGAIRPTNERDAFLALDLFGPYATLDAFKDVTDEARMKAMFDGARMGAYLHGHRKTDWIGKVERQLEQAGKTVELEGLRAAQDYRGPHSPRTADDVGITLTKRGESYTVVVGGYNMLRPETSSPLRPETRTNPSTFELNWLSLDKLTLKSKPSYPQSWVNPNAYLFTFTRSTGG